MALSNRRVLPILWIMMGLANPTVISCCHEFVQELCNFQNEIITFPSARADVLKKVQGFSMKSKVPNVVAAIDGSHIPSKAPLINHEDYFNRKWRFLHNVGRASLLNTSLRHTLLKQISISTLNSTSWILFDIITVETGNAIKLKYNLRYK